MKWHDPTIERRNSWMPDRSAKQRADALHILGDAVVLRKHPYDRSPNSGAGNCWCGRPQSSELHRVRDRKGRLSPPFKRRTTAPIIEGGERHG